jgi:hypothetical protein
MAFWIVNTRKWHDLFYHVTRFNENGLYHCEVEMLDKGTLN